MDKNLSFVERIRNDNYSEKIYQELFSINAKRKELRINIVLIYCKNILMLHNYLYKNFLKTDIEIDKNVN